MDANGLQQLGDDITRQVKCTSDNGDSPNLTRTTFVTEERPYYIGNGHVLWACITQFDAATGPGSFRSNRPMKDSTTGHQRDIWCMHCAP